MHILDTVATATNNTILYQIVVITNLAEHKGHQFGEDDVIHFVVMKLIPLIMFIVADYSY